MARAKRNKSYRLAKIHDRRSRDLPRNAEVAEVEVDNPLALEPGETPELRHVRFRTLGCYPLSGAIESEAARVGEIVAELRQASRSERQGRLIDGDSEASMERKKREGYF